jgi:hypothetical protein
MSATDAVAAVVGFVPVPPPDEVAPGLPPPPPQAVNIAATRNAAQSFK